MKGMTACKTVLIPIMVFFATGPSVRAECAFDIVPPDRPVFAEYHPAPKWVKEFGAAPGRVFATAGWWTGGYDYYAIYFRGDIDALNRMIGHYAALPVVERSMDAACVEIRDDRAEEGERLERLYRAPVPPFDWRVRIDTFRPIGERDPAKLEIKIFVDVWISDHTPLDKLQIPSGLRTTAVSRVEQFVNLHETARLKSPEFVLKNRISALQRELTLLEKDRASTRPAGLLRPKTPGSQPAP